MLEPGASLSICPESCLVHQEIISEQSTPAQAMHNTHSGKLDEVIPSSSSSITSMTKSRLMSLVIFSVMFLFAVLVGYQRRQHMQLQIVATANTDTKQTESLVNEALDFVGSTLDDRADLKKNLLAHELHLDRRLKADYM